MAVPERISVYNLSDLKNTTDDALQNYLNSLKFQQSRVLIDTRLALGYSSVAVAAACFLWDYKLGFNATKRYTAAAVVVYMLLNVAFTLWISLREKSIIYEGTSPSGSKISVSTTVKKHVPTYNVSVIITPTTGKPTTLAFSRPFREWFTAQGNFVAQPFQEMVATSVPMVGILDPKNFRTGSYKILEASPELLDAVFGSEGIAGGGSVVEPAAAKATGTSTGGKKKGRGRKVRGETAGED